MGSLPGFSVLSVTCVAYTIGLRASTSDESITKPPGHETHLRGSVSQIVPGIAILRTDLVLCFCYEVSTFRPALAASEHRAFFKLDRSHRIACWENFLAAKEESVPGSRSEERRVGKECRSG